SEAVESAERAILRPPGCPLPIAGCLTSAAQDSAHNERRRRAEKQNPYGQPRFPQKLTVMFTPDHAEREGGSGQDADDAERPANPVQYREVHGKLLETVSFGSQSSAADTLAGKWQM